MTTARIDRVVSADPVTKVPLPAETRAISTLSRIDYEDAFLVAAGVDRTAEQWLAAVLQGAPPTVRARLVAGWLALGLKLGPPWARDSALGWNVEQVAPGVVLLRAGGRFGLQGQLLFRSQPGGFLFATLVQLSNPAARAVWARITPMHQDVVRSLLRHAVRRETGGEAD